MVMYRTALVVKNIRRRRGSAYISFLIRKGMGYYGKHLHLLQHRFHPLLNSEVAGSVRASRRRLAP